MFQSQDVKEFVKLLIKHNVKFVLIGGYAVIHYTEPRYTKDIDFLIKASEENANCIAFALEEFGVPRKQINKKIFSEKENFFKIGNPPWRVDLITSVKGLDFNEIYADSNIIIEEGIELKIISKKHLIRIKKIAGRTVDLIDVESLEKLL